MKTKILMHWWQCIWWVECIWWEECLCSKKYQYNQFRFYKQVRWTYSSIKHFLLSSKGCRFMFKTIQRNVLTLWFFNKLSGLKTLWHSRMFGWNPNVHMKLLKKRTQKIDGTVVYNNEHKGSPSHEQMKVMIKKILSVFTILIQSWNVFWIGFWKLWQWGI